MILICKYELQIGRNIFAMDNSAEFLSFGEQDNKLNIWMLCNTDGVQVERCFDVLGTYSEVTEPECALYRASTVIASKQIAYHLFERLAI